MTLLILATVSAAAPERGAANEGEALHAGLLAPVRQCMAASQTPDTCLLVVRKRCGVQLTGSKNPYDASSMAFCDHIENEGREEIRVREEAKLEAAMAKDLELLAKAKVARRAWETYRDNWCGSEGDTAPLAFTGESESAEEACRKALTIDRLSRIRHMADKLTP